MLISGIKIVVFLTHHVNLMSEKMILLFRNKEYSFVDCYLLICVLPPSPQHSIHVRSNLNSNTQMMYINSKKGVFLPFSITMLLL